MNRNGATMVKNTYRLIQSRTSLFPSHACSGKSTHSVGDKAVLNSEIKSHMLPW